MKVYSDFTGIYTTTAVILAKTLNSIRKLIYVAPSKIPSKCKLWNSITKSRMTTIHTCNGQSEEKMNHTPRKNNLEHPCSMSTLAVLAWSTLAVAPSQHLGANHQSSLQHSHDQPRSSTVEHPRSSTLAAHPPPHHNKPSNTFATVVREKSRAPSQQHHHIYRAQLPHKLPRSTMCSTTTSRCAGHPPSHAQCHSPSRTMAYTETWNPLPYLRTQFVAHPAHIS